MKIYPKIVPFKAFKWFLGVHFSISPFLESAFKAFEDTEQSLEGLDERRHSMKAERAVHLHN